MEAEPVEDPDVGVAVQLVGLVQPGLVDVEGVGVLHDELATAQQAGARTGLVAVLGLDLVDRQRQVLVGREQVLDREGEHLLVGRPEQVVGVLAVLEAEDVVAVLGPPARRLEGLLGQQRREEQLLGADRVHLLADDGLDAGAAPAGPAAARCRCRGSPDGCSRPARAAGGSAARHRPGPREGFAGTGSTCAGPRDSSGGWTTRQRITTLTDAVCAAPCSRARRRRAPRSGHASRRPGSRVADRGRGPGCRRSPPATPRSTRPRAAPGASEPRGAPRHRDRATRAPARPGRSSRRRG